MNSAVWGAISEFLATAEGLPALDEAIASATGTLRDDLVLFRLYSHDSNARAMISDLSWSLVPARATQVIR